MCRVFKKRLTTVRRMDEQEPLSWYDDNVSFMPDFDHSPPTQTTHPNYTSSFRNHPHYSCKQELELQYYNTPPHERFLQLPQLESPKFPHSATSCNSVVIPYGFEQSSTLTQEEHLHQHSQALNLSNIYGTTNIEQAVEQVTDWQVLDKFVASQLGQDHHQDATKEPNCSNAQISESSALSTCQIDLWK